jgi:hypothetical protein
MADAAQRSVGCCAVRQAGEGDKRVRRGTATLGESKERNQRGVVRLFSFFACPRCTVQYLRLMPHVLGSPHCRRHIDSGTGAHPLPMSSPGLGSPLRTSAPGLGSPDTRTCTPARIMTALPGRAGLTPLEPSCRCSLSATRWTMRAERSQRRVATGCNMPQGSATGPVASSDI